MYTRIGLIRFDVYLVSSAGWLEKWLTCLAMCSLPLNIQPCSYHGVTPGKRQTVVLSRLTAESFLSRVSPPLLPTVCTCHMAGARADLRGLRLVLCLTAPRCVRQRELQVKRLYGCVPKGVMRVHAKSIDGFTVTIAQLHKAYFTVSYEDVFFLLCVTLTRLRMMIGEPKRCSIWSKWSAATWA